MNREKAQMLTDPVTQSRAWGLDAQVLSVAPGEGAGWCQGARGGHCLCKGCCKTCAECCFRFPLFFVKAKIPLGFLLVSGNSYCYRSFVSEVVQREFLRSVYPVYPDFLMHLTAHLLLLLCSLLRY